MVRTTRRSRRAGKKAITPPDAVETKATNEEE